MDNLHNKLPIQISAHSREPIYYQIEQQLISLIVSGQLKPGTILPSIRSLASDLACSVITTSRAYQNLEQRKFIYTIQGKGTFVSEVQIEEKQKIADTSLYQAFYNAVDMSFRMQNDAEQTRKTFESVLHDYLEKGEKPI